MTLTWELLADTAARVGAPFFIANLERVRTNYVQFQEAFAVVYPGSVVAYSLKANYLPAICREIMAAGGWIEVSSGMEYSLARRAGVSGDRLVFNGPGKTEAEIGLALGEGAWVNLESLSEVEMAVRAATGGSGRPCGVGLRCNPRQWTGVDSRFGFEPGDELAAAMQRLEAGSRCRLAGLHLHICTADKSVATYDKLARGVLALSAEVFRERPPDYLNLGGGFFSRMEASLRAQFDCPVPNFATYAAALAGPFAAMYGVAGTPRLMLEPGLAVAADALCYCAQVTDVRLRSGRCLAILAATVYDAKPTLSQRNPPLEVLPQRPGSGEIGPWDLTGYTCMEHDVLYRGYLGRLAPGDFVVFGNTGAYTLVLSPAFIRPRPAVVRLAAGGAVEVLKRRETADEVMATYVFS